MALTLANTLSYYKRRDIQEEMVRQAKDKEVGARYDDFFGKRPDVLKYPADVLELAKNRMTSLHCSEENWTNPLQLSTSMSRDELNSLRKGWDLVLDIDCKFFEYSKLAALHTVNALKVNAVKSITVKFSGNKGFHIAVPFEAFPKMIGGKRTSDLFPDAPKRMALYLADLIRKPLADDILAFENNSFMKVVEKTGLKAEEITRYENNEFGDRVPKLSVDRFLEIDTLLISQRHLYRMPYSLHEKSGLVSLPVDPDSIMNFKKEDAVPQAVAVKHTFLDRSCSSENADQLLRCAFDYTSTIHAKDDLLIRSVGQERKHYDIPEKAIGEEAFPPCIRIVLSGLEDGKKRSCFALIKFLAGCGWDYSQVEERLLKWNESNPQPLKPQIILSQVRYAKQSGGKLLPPPGCSNLNYYKGIGVCKPDELCARIKNPLQYARLKESLLKRAFNASKASDGKGKEINDGSQGEKQAN
jgi:hypothetical protein